MLIYTEHAIKGYERVLEAKDPSRKFHAIFAIHSTARGPAAGGTRAKVYTNTQEAITDALHLSRGMSHKSAGAQRINLWLAVYHPTKFQSHLVMDLFSQNVQKQQEHDP